MSLKGGIWKDVGRVGLARNCGAGEGLDRRERGLDGMAVWAVSACICGKFIRGALDCGQVARGLFFGAIGSRRWRRSQDFRWTAGGALGVLVRQEHIGFGVVVGGLGNVGIAGAGLINPVCKFDVIRFSREAKTRAGDSESSGHLEVDQLASRALSSSAAGVVRRIQNF